MSSMQPAESGFDSFYWHDCRIWGFSFREGEPENNDWSSELVFDIDFICEWCCTDVNGRFKVAPACLVFHGVQDLHIDVRWSDASLIHPLSIAEISREAVSQYSIAPGKPNYRWCIRLNWPRDGEIAFSSSGYTQTLLTPPVLIDEQSFSTKERAKLLVSEC